MSKTIKQIADEIGVSKQAVYKRYKGKLHTDIHTYAHTYEGVIYIEKQGEILIKQDFSDNTIYNGAHTERIRSALEYAPKKTNEDEEVQFLRELVDQLQTELITERQHNREKDKQLLETLSKLADISATLTTGQTVDKQKALVESIVRGEEKIQRKGWQFWKK